MPDTPDQPQGTPNPAPTPQPQPAPQGGDPYAAFRPQPAPGYRPAGPAHPSAAPRRERQVEYKPMDRPNSLFGALEDLLKRPGSIIYELQQKGKGSRIFLSLYALILLCLLIYGLVVGTFTGGWQFLIAPAKIIGGLLICYVITLPSLYIFMCLGGAEVTFRGVAGLFLAVLALMSVLLIGFAPVAWIFSQSTSSIALMTLLHAAFWFVGLCFGLKILTSAQPYLQGTGNGQVVVWSLIFMAVCLQMMTALRPIIGKPEPGKLLPTEKKFFLQHWSEITMKELSGTGSVTRGGDYQSR
jgi:hypothetical protein